MLPVKSYYLATAMSCTVHEQSMCCVCLKFYSDISFFPKHMIRDPRKEVLVRHGMKEGIKTFFEIWRELWLRLLDVVIYESFDQRMWRSVPSYWFQGNRIQLFACMSWIQSFPEVWTRWPVNIFPDPVIRCHELKTWCPIPRQGIKYL